MGASRRLACQADIDGRHGHEAYKGSYRGGRTNPTASTENIPAFCILIITMSACNSIAAAPAPVKLQTDVPGQLSISNGIFNLTLSEQGYVYRIEYGSLKNLLVETDPLKPSPDDPPTGGPLFDRAYYDIVGDNDLTSRVSFYERPSCSSFKVTYKSKDRVTVEFLRPFNPLLNRTQNVPADVYLVFSVAAGVSGFHSYIRLDHKKTMASGRLQELRFVLKLRSQIFQYSVISDDRQRFMPSWADIGPIRSTSTKIPEARRIVDPDNLDFKYEVDHKYNYMAAAKDRLVYGWISNTAKKIGIWLITPHRTEHGSGGPFKQDLTVQTAGILLNYLHSGHLGTPDVAIRSGTPWSKVYGPWFCYLNIAKDKSVDLWADAKQVAASEVAAWPYSWAGTKKASDPYPGKAARGAVSGQLVVRDSYINMSTIDLTKGWIGLAPPGPPDFWSRSVNGYQFWTQPAADGKFEIKSVRYGTYNLYAFVPRVLGDYKYGKAVQVAVQATVKLGTLTFLGLRVGPTIWEIGLPDRDSAEFYVPVMNPLSPYPYAPSSANRFRNYGVWDTYAKAFPKADLKYLVGRSQWSRDWWYVQPTRFLSNGKFAGTTWSITFDLNERPKPSDRYLLRMAVAGFQYAFVDIRSNGENVTLLDTRLCGCTVVEGDNVMARAASYGSHYIYNIPIQGSSLFLGLNTITLGQRSTTLFGAVMYDYLRLEGPKRN